MVMDTNTGTEGAEGLIGGGLLATTPFAGMIGERPVKFDPFTRKGTPQMTLRQLSRTARPGDVLLTARPGWEGFKMVQTPFSGSEFFHVAPVLHRRKGMGTALEAGELWGLEGSPQYIKSQAKNIPGYMREHGYRDVVLLRPDRQMTPSQLRRYQEALTRRITGPYDVPTGIKATLKDIFVPKIRHLGGGKKLVCYGDVCSTLPAQARHEAGILEQISRGKKPREVLPIDYLREGSGFKPIGAFLQTPGKVRFSPEKLRAIRLATRTGIGGVLGGTAAGAYYYPPAGAAILGAGITPMLVRAALRGVRKPELAKKIPTLGMMSEAFATGDFKPGLKKFLTRTGPLGLLGGLGAYVGAKKLYDKWQEQ